MADGIIQLATDGSGKKRDASELTVGSNTVERERLVIADPTNASGLGVVKNANPSGTEYASIIRPTIPRDASKRTQICLFFDEINSLSTEALVSMTVNKGGTVNNNQTSYTVTTGKTFRVSCIVFSVGIATTTGGQKKGSLRLRADPSTVVATSPVYVNIVCGSNALAAVNEATETEVTTSDGLEFGSGWQIGLTEISPGTASRTVISACVVGFEY